LPPLPLPPLLPLLLPFPLPPPPPPSLALRCPLALPLAPPLTLPVGRVGVRAPMDAPDAPRTADAFVLLLNAPTPPGEKDASAAVAAVAAVSSALNRMASDSSERKAAAAASAPCDFRRRLRPLMLVALLPLLAPLPPPVPLSAEVGKGEEEEEDPPLVAALPPPAPLPPPGTSSAWSDAHCARSIAWLVSGGWHGVQFKIQFPFPFKVSVHKHSNTRPHYSHIPTYRSRREVCGSAVPCSHTLDPDYNYINEMVWKHIVFDFHLVWFAMVCLLCYAL
jgi:hypothetical protein